MGTAIEPHGEFGALSRFAEARVLVVDDHGPTAALLERVIGNAGLEGVEVVTDARDVARSCLELEPDLVLLDLHMPHLDGYEVLASLRGALPADIYLPIVVLTGDATTDARDRVLSAGATDFLTKPFDRTEVILRVRNLLESRSLHTRLRQHNQVLRADLDAREETERQQVAERRAIDDRIDDVLAANALQMMFQPIADLHTGAILGVEALARFAHDPPRPPNVWFEEAATIGRGDELEIAAASAALRHLGHLPDEAFLSINLSPAAVLHPDLAALLTARAPHRVVVELTEHAAVDDYDALVTGLQDLRASGVRVAVDDAGAGYAGLRHILQLLPDILKLDIELTRGIDADPARRALGSGLVTFAEEIGATIIAEGIENEHELATLRDLGVPCGQGYHLARPGPLPLPTLQLPGFERQHVTGSPPP